MTFLCVYPSLADGTQQPEHLYIQHSLCELTTQELYLCPILSNPRKLLIPVEFSDQTAYFWRGKKQLSSEHCRL